MGYAALIVIGLGIFAVGIVLGAGAAVLHLDRQAKRKPGPAEPFGHHDHFGEM